MTSYRLKRGSFMRALGGASALVVIAAMQSACSGRVKEAGGGPEGGQGSGTTAGDASPGGAASSSSGSTTVGPGGTTNGSTATTGSADGSTGSSTGDTVPCSSNSDPRLVVAPQRILRLTFQEFVNSIRSFVDTTEATALLTNSAYGNIGAETDMAFPPLDANREGTTIDDAKFQTLDAMAQDVSEYVSNNLAALSQCSAPISDACATTYLNALAEKAYRRPLALDEQSSLTTLYDYFRSGINDGSGNLVSYTTEEATRFVVYALLSTPQLLYRSEIGDSAKMSTLPPGVPLTQYELATDLAFFLTDAPPDAVLLAHAAAGTLTGNLGAQVDRLLATQQAKDWLRTVMYTFYGLNFITTAQIDTTRVMVDGAPLNLAPLTADERIEAQKFLDHVLWNGNLTDLLTSRTTFLNPNLAMTIYGVPVPPGATTTTFVQTTLPADQRIGLLTNAAFFMATSRVDSAAVVPRGKLIKRIMTCIPAPAPPNTLGAPTDLAKMSLANQTAQQQVAYRAAYPECASCHAGFDPFGLVLDDYDVIGRLRTVDEINMPVDTHATLPPELGGATIQNVFDLAQTLASPNSPVFTNCMAQTVLQYALTDIYSAPVKLPTLSNAPFDAACATNDVVNRYLANGKTFGDMVRAAAASPAFSLRTPAP